MASKKAKSGVEAFAMARKKRASVKARANMPHAVRAAAKAIKASKESQTTASQLPSLESIEAELLKRSFRRFVAAAWECVEPARAFMPNFHIDAIADHLQAVSDGHIQNLLITVPPGHAKSLLVAVLWHPWMWIRNAAWRVITTTYSNDLTMRDSLRSRALLRSEWYNRTFRIDWQMQADQDTKGYYQNTASGFRYSTSVGGQSTGHRGDCLIIDDALSASDGESDAKREECIFWYDQAFANRLNDLKKGTRVMIGQRLRDNDLPGHVLKSDTDALRNSRLSDLPIDNTAGNGNGNGNGHPHELVVDWTHLKLPSVFDRSRRCITYAAGKLFWSDPREKDGELLFSALFPQTVIDSEKKRLGAYGFSAQHQQEPAPAGGGKFKREWFQYFDQEQLYVTLHKRDGSTKRFLKSDCWTFQTADLAPTDKESSCYTVIGTWMVSPESDLLLIDIHRFKAEAPEVKVALEGARTRWKPLFQGIENAHFGIEVCQEWLRRGHPLKRLYADKDKVTRSMQASLLLENGKVYFLSNAYWLVDFEDELLHFNKGEYDDQVDVFSYAALSLGYEAPIDNTQCKPLNLANNSRGQLLGSRL